MKTNKLKKPKIKKYLSLSIKQKIEILEEISAGIYKKSALARKYNIPLSTLSTILKDNDNLLLAEGNISVNIDRKGQTRPRFSKIEDNLIVWIKKQCN